MVDLRLVGFLSQPSPAITHRKTLLCHQPNVPLKEPFPGASDWPLTQILAAKVPVVGGNLGAVGLRRTQSWRGDRPEGSARLTARC